MSVNDLTKDELITKLQMSEYMRDALHFGVSDIGRILNVDANNKTDEELITEVFQEFIELVNNLPDNIKNNLNKLD
jgi:hypothetical protein